MNPWHGGGDEVGGGGKRSRAAHQLGTRGDDPAKSRRTGPDHFAERGRPECRRDCGAARDGSADRVQVAGAITTPPRRRAVRPPPPPPTPPALPRGKTRQLSLGGRAGSA